MIKRVIKKVLRKAGYASIDEQHRILQADMVADPVFMDLYERCRPYTMTSMERLYSLYSSVKYVLDHKIDGDFVECGVWKGGSAMMMAFTLLHFGSVERRIYLYDTFEGMSEPTQEDKTFQGDKAEILLASEKKEEVNSIWCYSSLEEVKNNLSKTEYPESKLQYVQGKVEDTLRTEKPAKISLLRLDTDWYVSTRCELEILYPLLSPKGVLIIDDFGHWEGAKKAVVEYFSPHLPFLHRIDNTGRLLIKF